MYEFMNGNLHYCPFLCHFIYCMPFWKIANVNVCFLRSFWRFLKERMESCSNSKVLEEFSCRHSKRRCFTKNNKNNIKKLKKQIHCSTTNTHTNKKNDQQTKKTCPSFYPHPYPSTPFNPPTNSTPFQPASSSSEVSSGGELLESPVSLGVWRGPDWLMRGMLLPGWWYSWWKKSG